MAAELDKLAQYYRAKQNAPRADFYTVLAVEERANKTPESFSEGLVLPEGVIRLSDLTIGGMKPKELEKALIAEGHEVSDYAKYLLKSPDFTTLSDKQTISLIRTTVSAMGLAGNPTTDQIYEKANELGWDLCPAEVGPHLRLAYKDQPMYEWLSIGMKQIAGRDGSPNVFRVPRNDDGSWLSGNWAEPTRLWLPTDQLVFSPRK